MSVTAEPLGFATPDPEDLRALQNTGASNVAGTGTNWETDTTKNMDSGRAWRIGSSTSGARVLYTQAIEEAGAMAVGDSIYVLWEYCAASANVNLDFCAGGLQGDRNFTTGGWEDGSKAAGIVYMEENNGSLTVVVWDNNATQTTSNNAADLTVTRQGKAYIRDKLALKITLTDANTITVIPYKNGTAGTTHTHTNASGVGTLNFKTFRAGNKTALPKGGSCEAFVGNVFVSGAAMPGQSDVISYKLPDADGATNEWLASGGGAAAFGEWDDVFGSYSTTDYNTSSSTTASKKSIAGIAAHSVPADATVKLVGLNAASSFNGSAVDATRFLGITANATDIEKDITFSGGIAALHTNGAEFRFFATRGDGTAWTPSTVDSDAFYVRQAADAATREWRVYALGHMVWYEPAVAAGGGRSQAWVM